MFLDHARSTISSDYQTLVTENDKLMVLMLEASNVRKNGLIDKVGGLLS